MKTAHSYAGLSFGFREAQEEIEHGLSLTRRFLGRNTVEFVIPNWKRELERFRSDRHPSLCWKIPVDNPICTVPSKGSYQRDSKGFLEVIGTLSAIWEITKPIRKKKGRAHGAGSFTLTGNASTVVRILSCSHGNEIARWTFDVGVGDSPGCHFHTQINRATDCADSGCDVPRLPAIFFTPMAALEFLVGELFQDDWPRQAALQDSGRWRNIQKVRMEKLLGWKIKKLGVSVGSPWIALKASRPCLNLFE